MRILIIEDDSDLSANLQDYFKAKGHSIDSAGDGETGLHLATTNEYDVITMDVGMPDMDGLTACRKLREGAGIQTPLLMLTAKDTLDDKLAGFENGADDYLVKPFAQQELLARLTALNKRHREEPKGRVLRIDDLSLDTQTLEVRRADTNISLTPTTLRILELLMRNSPKVVSRQQIEAALWHDSPPNSDALRVHMYTLRNLVDRPFANTLIQTVHGIGFKLVAPIRIDDET